MMSKIRINTQCLHEALSSREVIFLATFICAQRLK